MFDPSDDLATVVDGLESVTLVRRGGGPSTVIANALRRATITAEGTILNRGDVRKKALGGGQYLAADVTWHLPVGELTQSPRLGDWILDGAGQRWTILEVKLAVLGARWRCTTRNVAVAFGLDDTISVLKAIYVKGSCGAAEPLWRTWKSGVRARIQPGETRPVDATDSHATVKRCRIFVEEDLDLDHTCRIRAADGKLYKILAVLGAERIGELQVIEAEVAE